MHLINGVTKEMESTTQAKFDYWDNVIAKNILETGTENEKNEVYKRLKDPTIYAYAFLRDPRDTSKPFKLYAYQDMIINDPHLRIQFTAANQIGKSITLCLKAITYALQHPGHTVLMTSKTLPQAKDLLRQIKSMLNSSILDYKDDVGESETKTEIYFKHHEEVEEIDEKTGEKVIKRKSLPQSRIICVPATEAALGYAVHLALGDEINFYDDGEYFYFQILQPRTYTTKGQIINFSNPNGQQGIGWKLWNDKNYNHYKFDFLDCPTNTKDEFDRISSNLTQEQIDSTLLAVFTSPEGGFLTLQERNDMQQKRPSMLPSLITTPIYIFFDWAKTRDRTVRVIGIPVKKEHDWAPATYVYEMIEYPQGTSYSDIIDGNEDSSIESLKDFILRIGPQNIAMVGWDNTGVGSGIEDFIKRVEQLGVQAMPVLFSAENKSRIYTLFKLLAEQRRIKIPHVTECDKQLSMLRFKKSPRGLLKVHHASEKDRDDYPDALAGLCSLIIQPTNIPVSCEMI